MKDHFWIPSRGKRLSAMLHMPDEVNKDTPIIVCCHGFTGDKIGANQLTLNLAKELERSGYIVVRFDYLGSGDSDGDFPTDTIVTGWKEDLINVLAWVRNQSRFSASPLLLYGHSLGGLVALTHSATDQGIAARIVFAPVIYPIPNFQHILGAELWAQSVAGQPIANFFGKGFRLEGQFVKDLLENNYDPLGNAVQLKTPLLVIHGLEDVAVPIQGSIDLYEKYAGPKLFLKPQIDHVATGNYEVPPRLILEWLAEKFPIVTK
ncbi:MAG: exosortase system-associated hydrolase 1 [Firmicutes bacterium]|nr:exosortase system-associated hydrolase 1 [Bacillota bacterium]